MPNSRFLSIATAAVVVLNLGVVTSTGAGAAQGNNGLCVAVSGGTVANATDLAIDAGGGTSIGDASGGTGNVAFTPGNDNETTNGNNTNNDHDNNNSDHNNNNNDHNNNNNDHN